MREQTEAQTAQTRPKLGLHQEQLEVFAGKWTAQGQLGASTPEPGARMTSEQSVEWLPGGFFLVCRWKDSTAAQDHEGISVLGHDAALGEYFWHVYDNLGYARRYAVSLRGRTWTLSGKWERATYVVSNDANSFTYFWEQTKDGSTWLRLCEMKATRVV